MRSHSARFAVVLALLSALVLAGCVQAPASPTPTPTAIPTPALAPTLKPTPAPSALVSSPTPSPDPFLAIFAQSVASSARELGASCPTGGAFDVRGNSGAKRASACRSLEGNIEQRWCNSPEGLEAALRNAGYADAIPRAQQYVRATGCSSLVAVDVNCDAFASALAACAPDGNCGQGGFYVRPKPLAFADLLGISADAVPVRVWVPSRAFDGLDASLRVRDQLFGTAFEQPGTDEAAKTRAAQRFYDARVTPACAAYPGLVFTETIPLGGALECADRERVAAFLASYKTSVKACAGGACTVIGGEGARLTLALGEAFEHYCFQALG